jgi:predicted NBD/HSP70 family sugar kinase
LEAWEAEILVYTTRFIAVAAIAVASESLPRELSVLETPSDDEEEEEDVTAMTRRLLAAELEDGNGSSVGVGVGVGVDVGSTAREGREV